MKIISLFFLYYTVFNKISCISEGVYFPNYISNSSTRIFSIKGENETNCFIRVSQGSNGESYLGGSNNREGYSFSTTAYKVLAKVLANISWNNVTEFEGYKFEWRVE